VVYVGGTANISGGPTGSAWRDGDRWRDPGEVSHLPRLRSAPETRPIRGRHVQQLPAFGTWGCTHEIRPDRE